MRDANHPVYRAIRALGGPTRVAILLDPDCRHGLMPHTVEFWLDRAKISSKWEVAFWIVCVEKGVDWKPPMAGDWQLVRAPARG